MVFFIQGRILKEVKHNRDSLTPKVNMFFKNIYSLYRLCLNDYMHMLHKHTGGLEVFLIQYI